MRKHKVLLDSGSSVVPGDELVLRRLMGSGEIWQSKGLVKIVSNGCVHVELMERQCPTEHLNRFSLEFVWKAVTFDRMQDALRTFALDDESVSQYIFHKLLGHQVVRVVRVLRVGLWRSLEKVKSSD